MNLDFWSGWFRKFPKNPETVFEPFVRDMARELGEELLCLVVFGSAASGDYIYRRSNINTAMVLPHVHVSHLRAIANSVEKWMNKGLAVPRMFARSDFERSLDAFPLLFMEIRDNHRLLHGKSLFANVVIDPGLLRVQVEQMLKSKVAEARSEFLASGESLKTFEDMISRSFGSLFPLLRGLLFLAGVKPSVRKEVVVAMSEEKFHLEPGVLTDALRQKNGLLRISEKHNLLAYYERYMAAIERLADIADTIQIP
jgi:hypothetical protein